MLVNHTSYLKQEQCGFSDFFLKYWKLNPDSQKPSAHWVCLIIRKTSWYLKDKEPKFGGGKKSLDSFFTLVWNRFLRMWWFIMGKLKKSHLISSIILFGLKHFTFWTVSGYAYAPKAQEHIAERRRRLSVENEAAKPEVCYHQLPLSSYVLKCSPKLLHIKRYLTMAQKNKHCYFFRTAVIVVSSIHGQ